MSSMHLSSNRCTNKLNCYTSQLKCIFWLEENMSDAMGQISVTPKGNNMNFRLTRDQDMLLETTANLWASQFLRSFSTFELGGITKHLMTGPARNSEFCFPSTSMFPEALPWETLRVSERQNLLFPLGPVINCSLCYNHCYNSI